MAQVLNSPSLLAAAENADARPARSKRLTNLRNRHLLFFDLLVLILVPALAFTLRVDGFSWWPADQLAWMLFVVISLLVKLPIFYQQGLYRRYWRYAGVNDLYCAVMAVGISTFVLTVLFGLAHPLLTPYKLAVFRLTPLIDGMLTLIAVGGVRFGLRGLYHSYRQRQQRLTAEHILVVGAGEAGAMVVNEMLGTPELKMKPVAFLDDDVAKINTFVKGIPVAGGVADVERVVQEYGIQEIIVALPSVPFGRRQEIVDLCKASGVTTRSLPGIYELLAGHQTVSRLPQIDVNQLLGRDPIQTDTSEVATMIEGAVVLVTGAGGSIGSELCRQIASFEPAEIILLGHGENSIFEIGLDLRLAFPNLVTRSLIVDVRDKHRVARAIEKYKPKVIFHAAAHKHVPFMEENVEEAIINNVSGTYNLLQAAERNGVERFILISTDKAVNPSSIMGATKRLAELLVQSAAQRSGHAYMAVRFGNVLGSRGSVIPIFQRQIAAGGPLTVTHPEMRRYFMTIPEAVQLVLQAAVLGQGSEIFLLDMGEPVRIMDLAAGLLRLSGLVPERDIKIVHPGIRPGEKLNEELFLEDEVYKRTRNDKVFVATHQYEIDGESIEQVVSRLITLAQQNPTAETLDYLHKIIPEYRLPQYLHDEKILA
ncbi:MAG: nucleoside-diphosphate sugar epimerase/dehydratase [Caldilineaceae bacterium]